MTPTQAITPTAGQGLLPTSESVLGKDDFLKILVTQLTHQDPINPIKGEEFAAQLAQFSSVEQLHNINSNLENVLDMDLLLNQAINNTLATTLIGKEVKSIGNRVSLHEGESVNLHYRLSSPASKVVIEIKDSAGTLVRSVELQNLSEG
ncbi:MAG: flagellar hook assembly protein FlgD, partial [bacterium]